jgi:carboxymethylenebutenolidase
MRLAILAAGLVIAAPVLAQQQKPSDDPHAGHAMEMQQTTAAAGARQGQGAPSGPSGTPADAKRDPNLPPPGDVMGPDKNAWAKSQLDSSPRHVDWVDIKSSNGGAPIKTFIVYPERKDKAPVVIVIQEIFGLTDWIRGVADQLAKEGFIAVAPDFLSGMGPNGGGSTELGEQESTKVIGKLTADDRVRILNDVRNYALKIQSANGKTGTVGFCWGGGASFLFALNQPGLDAAVSYYGPMADDLDYSKAKTPILGLYGGNDNRVNAGIDKAKAELAKKNVTYDPHIFDGAGHGFLRAQGGSPQAPGNKAATEQAWPLTIAFLKKYTK